MSLSDLSSRAAVLEAIREFDEDGEEAFLRRYGYRRALRWVLRHNGKEYPSKAIAGVAYSKQFPDRVALRDSGRITGGEHTVVRKLRELGFDVERADQPMPDPEQARAWIIRAGREGRDERLAVLEGVAVLGWSETGELRPPVSRDDLKNLIRAFTGEERDQSLNAQAGQIYRFIHEVEVGDVVVLPLKSNPDHVAVGRVLGPYQFRDDGPFEAADAKHTRPVEWVATAEPYDSFPADIQDTFGQQGTLSEIGRTDAAARIMDAMSAASASPLHLLLRWSFSSEPKTISLHREIAAEHGAVWWAKFGDPEGRAAIAEKRLETLRDQLADGLTTFVYLHRTGEVWRAKLLEIQVDRPGAEAQLIPAYYRDAIGQQHLWVKLTDFEHLPAEFAERRLVLDGSADPESVAKAFRGQASLLYVRHKSASQDESGSSVWWVNQGASYTRARDGGYLWAPKLTKDGAPRPDWDALTLARADDRVLHYANGSVRAIGRVRGEAFDASRPAPEDEQSWTADGRRLAVEYSELDIPIDLAEIPADWRESEEGPFDKNGSVKQGYFYPLSPEFVSVMAERFPQLQLSAETPRLPERLTPEAVQTTAENLPYRLNLEPELYATIVAALESGKHVILTGPPGTAKTTLAQAVADTAKGLGLCDGYLLTTATADWTTYETIGGLRPKGANQLEFEPGHFLQAIASRQWLVIDELNRSQFDRAFGQLFTVLSGQAVTLPYSRPGAESPLTLLPAGAEPPSSAADVLQIPREWRIVATMNVFDKSLLFEMSYALMRRFAFIEVPSPGPAVFEELIELWAEESDEAADVAKDLMSVRAIKDIGPAVYGDIARFAAQRVRLGTVDPNELRFQAFYSYLLPQFEGINDEAGEALLKLLATAVGGSMRQRLRDTLNTVLGLELRRPQGAPDGSGGGEPADSEVDEDFEETP